MLFDIAMPASMTIPMSDMTLRVVPVSQSVTIAPAGAGGKREKDDEWIDERPELRYQDQIEKQQRMAKGRGQNCGRKRSSM